MPWAARPRFIRVSLVRSPLFQAPPWTSRTVGNGPVPTGRYTRASQGSSPRRWYSTSLTSTSNSTLVAMRGVYTSGSNCYGLGGALRASALSGLGGALRAPLGPVAAALVPRFALLPAPTPPRRATAAVGVQKTVGVLLMRSA